MYKMKKSGWLAHFDFKLIDVASMLVMYFLMLITGEEYSVRAFISGAIILVLIAMIVSITAEVHHDILHRKPLKEFAITVIYIAFCELFTVIYLVLLEEKHLKELNIWIFLLGGIVLDFLAKQFYKWSLKSSLKSNTKKYRLVLVATDDNIMETLDRFEDLSFGQFEIDGIVLFGESQYNVGDEIRGYTFLCKIEDLPAYVQKMWMDEIMVNLPTNRLSPDIIKQITEMGLAIHRVIDFDLDYHNTKVVEKIGNYTCLTESLRIVKPTYVVAKRFIDIVGAIVGSLVTILLIIVIGPIIYFTDPGPIFFKQRRMGKGGREFNILKFRSMYKDAEARKAELMHMNQMSDGLMFKMDNDPRILGSGADGTKKGIGWFIRKFSIDECPQFFNVLKGEMSLVGTRPPTLDEWAQYGATHRARMAVRPGITGMWQTNGRSEITDFEEVVELDMEYIRNASISLDMKIILKTIVNIFTDSGAK